MLECCQKAGLYAFQTVFTMFVVLLLEGCGTGFQLLDGFSRRLRVHLFPEVAILGIESLFCMWEIIWH